MDQIDWMHFPPLSALRAFEATARLGSFSAAARALNVTHAAVAQQVRGLENHIGFSLVHRDGRALALSEDGARLARAASDGFLAIQVAVSELRSSRDGKALSVTMTPIFAEKWLVPRLKSFWAQHPDIALTLKPESRVVDLRREGVDLGIRFGLGHWPGSEASFLTSARYVVVGAPSLLQETTRLSPAEFASLPWVVEQGWAEPLAWLRDHGVDTDTLQKTTLPTDELAISAARQGYGLHVESAALVEQDVRDGRLRILFDPQDDNPGYYVVAPKGPQNPAARHFIKWLRSSV